MDYYEEHLLMTDLITAPVQTGGCCGQDNSNVTLVSNPAPVAVSGCGCEPGKSVATVTNDQGLAVSACCGKPVSTDKTSTACCG
jgi:hypothetical protein